MFPQTIQPGGRVSFSMGDTVKRHLASDKNADGLEEKATQTSKERKKKGDQWDRFLEIAQEQKDKRGGGVDKGVQIFIDTDIKRTLDKLKISGLSYSARYMLNAAVRTFFETNADKLNEQLSKA